jgi:hypothetical protein
MDRTGWQGGMESENWHARDSTSPLELRPDTWKWAGRKRRGRRSDVRSVAAPPGCRSELRPALVAQAFLRRLIAHGFINLSIERSGRAARLLDLLLDERVALARELVDARL